METLIAQLSQIRGALPASYSRMQCLEQCPMRFNLTYVNKPKDPVIRKVNLETASGLVMHQSFEECGKSNKPVSKDTFKQTVSHTGAGYRSDVQKRCSEIAEKAYDTYASARSLLGDDAVFLTEQRFVYNRNWKIYQPQDKFPKDAAWIGFADVVSLKDNNGALVDYKTEALSAEREKAVAKQTDLYAEAIFDTYPDVDTLSTYVAYVLDGTVNKKAEYSRENLAELRERNKELFSRYLEGLLGRTIWEPYPGPYCRWCKFNKGFGCSVA